MAVASETYQRFESQKVVGRHYPWSSPHQLECCKQTFARTKSIIEEHRVADTSYIELPESEHIMRRFKALSQTPPKTPSLSGDEDNCEVVIDSPKDAHKSLHLGHYNLNSIENDLSSSDDDDGSNMKKINSIRQNQFNYNIAPEPSTSSSSYFRHKARPPSLHGLQGISDEPDHLDFSPNKPAPPPPPSGVASMMINRVSTFKDMLFFNAELIIKENVPRLPENLFNERKYQNTEENNVNAAAAATPASAPVSPSVDDETDFIMPTRRKMIEGIEQEDFVGKSVAFTAWVLFLLQRMVALSAFFFFYPMACVYLCCAHYVIMVCCLYYETRRLHTKIERSAFYLFLAYVYIFCILEFKIKFKKPRYWFVGYVTLVLMQNLIITLIWYLGNEFESWWFEYLFGAVILTLCYSIMCLLVYFFLLKPPDKILFENNDGKLTEH